MTPMQARIIYDLHAVPSIDPEREVRLRVDFVKEYLIASRAAGLVLGVSGGQDSSLAGRLCQQAITELSDSDDSIPRQFIAVRLPYSIQADEDDAQLALTFIRPDRIMVVDIKPGVDGVAAQVGAALGTPIRDFVKGNTKARIRMVSQYAIAGGAGMLVVGTDHAAEAITGFFTKFGDGGADILPLSGLSKRQGRAMLRHLGAPERLYLKEPTADLLDEVPGQTDEANLGLTYEQIDDYLEGEEVDPDIAGAIEERYIATRHKRAEPVTMFDEWWTAVSAH